MISARDVHSSVEFYKEKFGFEVEDETESWAELKMENGMELAIKKAEEESIGSSGLGFAVNNCRKATDVLRERGAKIVKDCEPRENGSKILTQVKDPDGDIIGLVQKVK
ncbi:MAG: VOC family protein [Candidatus Zambryskibacteria bacterium]